MMDFFTRYCKAAILLLSVSLWFTGALAQKQGYIQSLNQQNHWVDSVLRKLNKKQKIAQLFMVRAYSNKSASFEDSVAAVIKKEQLGGVVFFKGGPQGQAALTNRYQKLARVPLLIAIDGEWGLGMRLDSAVSYPYQMTLGAIQDNALLYKMGQQVARDFKRLGIQMNFGPVMDINNNPNNPVISYRSFGDNKYNVAAKAIKYIQGMQSGGLLTTAKHFPGHGDTDVDSHLDLPQLPFSRQRLDSLEEYPFREAIKAGISSIMVAHMNIPALDATQHLPSTLSKPIVTGVLKDSLGFKGLIVSDAMDMKGVVKYFPNGEADVRAFIAGNDILELSENSQRAIKLIRKAIRKGVIQKNDLDERVKKVLAAKYWAGLNNRKEISEARLIDDLNRPEAIALVQQLNDEAITLLKNSNGSINPITKTALVSIGVTQVTAFQHELSEWLAANKIFVVAKNTPANQLNLLLDSLKSFDQIIIGIHDERPRPASKLDYASDVKLFIAELAAYKNTTISVFANPYAIAGLPGIEKCGTLLCGYQMSGGMQHSAVKVITGQLKPKGKLSVSVNAFFPYGTGL